MASPLIQGGLEILIKITVTWESAEKLEILMTKVKDVEYPIAGEYIDNSKDILNELGVENDDECDDCESGSDCEVEVEEDENRIDEILVD